MTTKFGEQLKSWFASWMDQGWTGKARDIGGALALLVMSVLLVMLFAGDRFKDSLSYLGLYNQKGGVYADCSKSQNRNNRFCGKPSSQEQFRRKASGIPFSLSAR